MQTYSNFHVSPLEPSHNAFQITANWFAVQTFSRHEKTVASQLAQDGVETMLPLTRQERKWSDRKKILDFPLFPGYVFVKLSDFATERFRILRKNGVSGFVGGNHGAFPIPEDEIRNVRLLTQNKIPANSHSYLRVGQRVRIRDGALRGLEGILERVANDHSLILSIDLIQRSVSVRIEGYSFEVL